MKGTRNATPGRSQGRHLRTRNETTRDTMWHQYDNPVPYGLTDQEPPLAEFLDESKVIVLIEKEEGELKIYPFPTLESEKRDLVKSTDAENMLAWLHVPQNAPDWYEALIAGRGVLYIKVDAASVSDIFTQAT
jgi:hypothetical protein